VSTVNTSKIGRTALALGAASMLALAGCGSDDGSADSNTEACDAWIAADGAIISFLFTGEGDADTVNAALDAAIAAAPDDVEQTMTDLKTEAQPQLEDPDSDASDTTLQLYSDAISWAGENCDVETLDVTATEFEYDGVPAELTTGYHVVDFTNEGEEQHEMFTFMINDGVTESLDEIFALPEEEIFSKITPVNAVFATPGTSEMGSWNLASPGSYAAICFIPVGSVGDAEGDGPPHFVEGMIHEFTVTS